MHRRGKITEIEQARQDNRIAQIDKSFSVFLLCLSLHWLSLCVSVSLAQRVVNTVFGGCCG